MRSCSLFVFFSLVLATTASIAKPIVLEQDCHEVGNSAAYVGSAYNAIGVLGAAYGSLGYQYDSNAGKYLVSDGVRDSTKVYVSLAPKHGKIGQKPEDVGAGVYGYSAYAGYVGADEFTIGVDTKAKNGRMVHFMLKYRVSVVDQITNEESPSTCERLKFGVAAVTQTSVSSR